MKPEDIDKLFRAKLEDHQGAPQLPAWGRLQDRLQQPQAEHSVDALFRSKLENHPTPLPENLWERLQARLNGTETKTRPMWVWYAAACIGLLLSVGGLWKYQLNQTNQIAIKAPVTTSEQTKTNLQPMPHSQTGTLAEAAKSEEQQTETESNLTPANQPESTVSERKEQIKAVLQPAMQTQLAVNMPVAESNAPKAQSPSNPENQANPENPGSDLTPANQPKKPVSAEPIETGPVVIGAPQYAVAEPLKVDIILAAETEARQQLQDLQEQEPQSRGNFASRLAKNLLKVKNGEKPDLQELGLAQSYTMQVKTRTQTLSKTINL